MKSKMSDYDAKQAIAYALQKAVVKGATEQDVALAVEANAIYTSAEETYERELTRIATSILRTLP